jgi:hypothetical protein
MSGLRTGRLKKNASGLSSAQNPMALRGHRERIARAQAHPTRHRSADPAHAQNAETLPADFLTR